MPSLFNSGAMLNRDAFMEQLSPKKGRRKREEEVESDSAGLRMHEDTSDKLNVEDIGDTLNDQEQHAHSNENNHKSSPRAKKFTTPSIQQIPQGTATSSNYTALESPSIISDFADEVLGSENGNLQMMSEVDLDEGENVRGEVDHQERRDSEDEDQREVAETNESGATLISQSVSEEDSAPQGEPPREEDESLSTHEEETIGDNSNSEPKSTPKSTLSLTGSLQSPHTLSAAQPADNQTQSNTTAAKMFMPPPSLTLSPPHDALATPDSSIRIEIDTPLTASETTALPTYQTQPAPKQTTNSQSEPLSKTASQSIPTAEADNMLTPVAPSPAAQTETPAHHTSSSQSAMVQSVPNVEQQKSQSKQAQIPRSSSVHAPITSNRSSSIFSAAFRGSAQQPRAMSVNQGSSHRYSQHVSPLTPAGPPPPLSPINPPLYNIPSPAHSSSHDSNRQRVVQQTAQNKNFIPPFHSHSSFTNLPLLKTICVPFNIAVPSMQHLTSYMDPLYFIIEPSLHVLNCIHNSPQFVIGFTVEQSQKQDIQKFDQIVKIVKSRFPFVIPCFVVIGNAGTRFSHEGYIAHVPSDGLAQYCRIITENIIVKFKTLSNKVITTPEKYMQQPITTHEQKTFDSTAKQMRADYIMVTGHFEYAHEEFEQALDMCKNNNDWITIAASHEGIAACLWHEWRRRNPNGGPPDQKLIQKIVKSYMSFLATIEKRNELRLYHTESMLRLAQFYADVQHWFPQVTVDAIQLLNDAVLEASIQSVQTKITVHGIAAIICQQMGCMRKYGFFLRQVAQFHHDLAHKQYLAVRYAAKAFECYDIPLKSNIYDETRPLHNLLRPAFEATHPIVTRGWNAVQRDCVKEVIQFASSQIPPDVLTEVQLSFFLLSCFHSVTLQHEQYQLFTRLCNLSAFVPSNQPLCVVPLPFVKDVIPNALPKHQIPEEDATAKTQAKTKKIFEYTTIDLSDSDEKKVAKVNWVQGDAASVTVTLHNPLMIQIQFKSVTIETDTPCTVYPAAATLAPQSSTKLKIRVIPHESCELFSIKNVLVVFAHNSKFPRPISIPANIPDDIEVTIVPSLPSLSVELPDKVIEIYEGEKNTALLTFTNMSSVPIDRMSWSVLPPGDAPKDLVKLNMESQHIPSGEFQKMELFVDGTSFLVDPSYHKSHIGKPQEYSMFLEYKCHAGNPLWLRRLTFKFSILVKECVTLDACVSINQQNGRQLVGRVSNFAPESIILLSSNMARKLGSHSENVDEEFHHLQHYHSKGVTIGPSQTKLVLLKYHIDHDSIEHVPYAVKNAHAYQKYFAQKLRWQTTVSNTTGIVALRATYSGLNLDAHAREEDLAMDVENETEIELRQALPHEFLQLSMNFTPALGVNSGERVTQPAAHEEEQQRGSPEPGSGESNPVFVVLGDLVTCEAQIRSSQLRDHPPRLCQMSVWTETVNGLSQAGPQHYMHSGSHQLHLNPENDMETHTNDLWFIAEGFYQIHVECTTFDGDNPISQPRKIYVHCLNRTHRDFLRRGEKENKDHAMK
uniref:Trs120/TRAPPC9 first Ig-like domain-containing protein n=1 Tax=Percolomonas cosmopolitus TaxID=63605 RepID=A0A7S1PI58_9EUKA